MLKKSCVIHIKVPSCYMDCPKCTNWPQPADIGQYQQTVATFIQKPVNYKWFGYKSPKDMMDVVFTMENKSLPFSTIAPQSDIHGVRVDPPLYKVSIVFYFLYKGSFSLKKNVINPNHQI